MTSLNDLVIDAVQSGEMSFAEIAERYNITALDVEAIFDDYLSQVEEDYDGQPDEAQEWYDFDPDC
jgi:uncharacterized protein (DUF433 family)